MTMQPATDPDCLAFFRTAEKKDKKKKDGLPLSEQDGGTLRVVGRALDSLDCLLVNRDEHQVFAVAIAPPSFSHALTRVIISEAEEVPDLVLNHAVNLLQSIYAARQLFRRHHLSAFRIPVSILRDADDPVLRQLMELEVTIFRYSWYAMRERFTQEDCHTALSRICDAVLASEEKTNPLLLPSLKADNLRPLRGDVSRHFSVLRLLLRRIGDLLAGSPGDSAIHQLPDYLAKLSVLIAEVQIHIPRLFEMLASYEPSSRSDA